MGKSTNSKDKTFQKNIFIVIIIICLSFFGGFFLGKSYTYSKGQSQSNAGIFNESCIHSLTFPELKGEMLAGYDDSYKIVNTEKYSGNSFSFNYPSDYAVSTDPTLSVLLTKMVPCTNFGIQQSCKAAIKISSTRPNLPIKLNEWFVQEDLSYFINDGRIDNQYMQQVMKTTTVDGELALYNSAAGDPGHFGNNVIFLHKSEAYAISIDSFGVPGAAAAFREVISSFKFTQ